MDLLPLPQRLIQVYPDTPVLCGRKGLHPNNYDYRGWLDFPRRKGQDKDELYRSQNDTTSDVVAKRSLLQSWLFFGLLIEFLDQDVSQDTFIETYDGQDVVAWSRVREHLSVWTRRVRSSNTASNRAVKTRLDALSAEAGPYVRYYCNHNVDEEQSPLEDETCLSILLLASLLELAKTNVSAHLPTPRRIPALPPTFLLKTLNDQNWCPSDVARMRSTLGSLLAIYYLSLIGPSRPELQHGNCDTRRCKAYQISAEAYRQRHIADCACHNIMRVDADQLSKLILDNKVPLNRLQVPLFGRSRLETITLDELTPDFVAISHVWSDGLGNPVDNALPRCQVETIQQWCNELFSNSSAPRSIPFWMDTLCIPYAGKAKKMAISSMSKVYELAAGVLVLDKDMLETTRSVIDLELTARMYSCGWLRRVWTLQEGVKAQKLYFRLKDGFIDLHTITQRVTDSLRGDHEFNASNQLAWEFLKPLIIFDELTTAHSPGLGSAITSVQFRDTTNAGDDLVCIKGILGWQEEEILHSSNAEPAVSTLSELQDFFLRQPTLHSDILFFGGRRMTDPGWRWAPAQLAAQNPYLIHGPSTSRATTEGLHGIYHGIHVIPSPPNTLKNAFMLYDQSNGVWLVVKDNNATDTGEVHIQDLEHRSSVSAPDWIDGLSRPALLLQQRLPRIGGTTCTVGVLVDIKYERNDVIHAAFCTSITLMLAPVMMVQQFETMKTKLGRLQALANMSPELVRLGSGVTDGQEWCIS